MTRVRLSRPHVQAAQSVHAQLTSAKGVLGRLLDELTTVAEGDSSGNDGLNSMDNIAALPYSAAAYSIDGHAKILEGRRIAPDMVSATSGVVKFAEATALAAPIQTLLEQPHSSLFGDTISRLVGDALSRSQLLGEVCTRALRVCGMHGNSRHVA